jgi:TPP-dependent pyruvate/acetoin dehydrogenase alpha subunit
MMNNYDLTEGGVDLYRRMYMIRAFELQVQDLVKNTSFARFVHLSAGQEAVAVGVCTALHKSDYVTLTYRCHGVLIARGADPERVLAEILGKRTGYCGGLAGSMHIVIPELGVLDATAIVSGNMPIAVGSALTSWLQEDRAVTVCFFGDGAVAEGSFHESMNLAALWKLPVVFVCENNHYAMATPFAAHSPIENIASRATAYGIPSAEIDGNDVFAVRATAEEAIAWARAGNGPYLIECHTCLLQGHYVNHIRKETDVEQLQQAYGDPVHRLYRQLMTADLGNEITNIESEIEAHLKQVVESVRQAPYPDVNSLFNEC